MIRVALIEVCTQRCVNFRRLLAVERDFACVGVCVDAEAALRTLPEFAPDIVVVELRLPGMDGIECTARLKRMLPATKVLVFTALADDERVFRALEAGADGYVLKGDPAADLVGALRELAEGGAPMSAEIARRVVVNFHRTAPPPSAGTEGLTPRQAAVLELLAEGCSAKEIGAKLAISPETVNVHLKHIYQKLNVRSRIEAVIKFRK
jgi:DNA-binding NarL/FixJ family response regulator